MLEFIMLECWIRLEVAMKLNENGISWENVATYRKMFPSVSRSLLYSTSPYLVSLSHRRCS